MSVRRALLAHALVVLVILMTASSPGPLSPLKADATRTAAPPDCPLVSPPVHIQVDPKDNRSPAVAHNPIHGEWLVVWSAKQGASTQDIWAARLDHEGRVLQTFNVATGAGVERSWPTVAFSPAQQQYLIVYTLEVSQSNRDIYATRINWNGAWVSKEIPIRVWPDQQIYPRVTYNSVDDEYLVVYTNLWAGGQNDIDAQRVRASDGHLKSWTNVHTGADGHRGLADVAYNHNRNEYLITYDFRGTSAQPQPRQIRGKVATASMAGLSTDPEIHLCCNPQAAPEQWGAAVAAGPDEYLVTFVNATGANYGPLYGRRVSHAGDPLGPEAGFPLTQNLPQPLGGGYVAFAGDGYLAIWSAYKKSGPTDHNVFGCKVLAGQDGAAGDDFVIADEAHWQFAPGLACAPQGNCLVVYEDLSDSGGSNARIRGRFVSPCPRAFLPLLTRSTRSP